MKVLILLILMLIPNFWSVKIPEDPYEGIRLEKVWETDGLSVPECVLLMPAEEIMYISNIGSKSPTSKNGEGFISILNLEGKILDLNWVSGLNSPKGMALFGDKLYVTEIDRLAEIDIPSGKKLKEYPIPGSEFLNDITADKDGNLYISDSNTGKIYRLSKGTIEVFVSSKELSRPNGVVIKEDRLLIGAGEKIVEVDLETREMTDYLLSTGAVDGLGILNEGVAIFSDWPGTIHFKQREKEKVLLLDTTSSETAKTADFGFDELGMKIYVPTFFANSIICYKIVM